MKGVFPRINTGVVLAGGASRRMGRDKAWVEFEGQPLIQRVLDRLSQVCDELIIVGKDQKAYRDLGVRLVEDSRPGTGALGGILTGLLAMRHEAALIVGCDMPFLNIDLLKHMLTLIEGADLVVPQCPDPSKPEERSRPNPTAKDTDLHPLHAVYGRNCLLPLQSRLESGDLRIISFFPDVSVRVIGQAEIERFDPRHLSLLNMNTPQDLELASELARQS